jgi:hypothetical protein
VLAVALIVTRDMEQHGLAASLKKVFPEVEFSVQKVDSFTSAKVTWPPPTARGVRSALEKYVTALLAALDPGRRVPRPDYVFGTDDLELENRQRPEAVIEAVRHAVAAELERRRAGINADSYDKLVARVKERCSFHLFVPMTEAYFYADPDALRATGCARQPVLVPDRDVELFQTTDPAYLAAPPQQAPSWACDPGTRAFHPKRYLQFLLAPLPYSETAAGVSALRAINWRVVLERGDQTLFVRSMFQDLAHAVGLDLSEFPGEPHPLTADYANRRRVLRNL